MSLVSSSTKKKKGCFQENGQCESLNLWLWNCWKSRKGFRSPETAPSSSPTGLGKALFLSAAGSCLCPLWIITPKKYSFLVSPFWKPSMPLTSLRWWTFQCQVQLELDGKSWYSLHRWKTRDIGTASAFATSLRKDAPHVTLSTWACVGVSNPSNNPQRGLSTAVKVFDFPRAKNSNQCLFSRSLSRYKSTHPPQGSFLLKKSAGSPEKKFG